MFGAFRRLIRSKVLPREIPAVNQKTAKMLSRWAGKSGKKERDLKRWWNTLDRKQRAAERKKISEALGAEAAEA